MNKNYGADAVPFASVPLSGGKITDMEDADPKKSLLAAVAAPAEAITAGVVAATRTKGKVASGINEALSYFFSAPLYQ